MTTVVPDRRLGVASDRASLIKISRLSLQLVTISVKRFYSPSVLKTVHVRDYAMQETFVEFTFEAAHQVPPYSGLHGHSFTVAVYLTGKRDPIFGWSHNLYEVEVVLQAMRDRLNDRYLNEIEGLEVPSLENIAAWIWRELDPVLPGLDRVVVRRGVSGNSEGCAYSGRTEIAAQAALVVEKSAT